jgi:hypothetical protein
MRVAVAEALGQFRNPEENERPLLEAVITSCTKKSNKSDYQSKPHL